MCTPVGQISLVYLDPGLADVIDKCKVMQLGRSNKAYDCSVDGFVLMEAKIEKDFGIMMSNDLKVSQQCLSAYNKANKNC